MDLEEFLAEWHNDSPTGQPKPMLVEKRRMEASARITCEFLGLHEGDTALLCMSLDYIAGKMMVVRSLVCGLRLISVSPSGLPYWEGTIDFAAMVPLQVWNLLHNTEGRERLKQIRNLIIGGGAIDEALELELQDFPNTVWSTYGMTETLSHIALRRLNGADHSLFYKPFNDVTVSLNEEQCLVINAPAVCDRTLITSDIAELSEQGFRILGRKDNVICSGGIKIQIEEVERLLRPYLSTPYIITRARDEKFGEVVVLLIEGTSDDAQQICHRVLPKYWQPRRIVTVPHIPMTETGKPARAVAEQLANPLGRSPELL